MKPKPSPSAPTLRERAEKFMRTEHGKNLANKQTDTDLQMLVHELQVHQIELELQNSELQEARNRMEILLEKYTDLYDFAPVGYFSLDENGLILEANLTGATLLGVERARLLQRRLHLFVTATSRDQFTAFLKNVFAQAGKQVCEASLLNEDGVVFWADLLAVSAISPSDPKKWCRVAVSDITDFKRAQDVLSRNEVLFTTIIQQAPVGVYVVNDQLRLQQINSKAQPVFGNVHPLVGRDLSEIMRILWSEKVAADVVKHFQNTLKTGNAYVTREFSEKRRDTGAAETYEWQIQRILLPSGQHGVVCFFNNITERRQVEQALQVSEARFRTLFDLGPIAVYSCDAAGVVTEFNRTAVELWGREPKKGDTDERFCGSCKLYRSDGVPMPHHKSPMALVLAGKMPMARDIEAQFDRPDGQRITVIVNIRPLKNARGEITGAINCFMDITERKRVEVFQRRVEMLASSNRKLELEIVRRQKGEADLKKSEQQKSRMLAESVVMQEQLRQLARQVMLAQEDERKEISRELHDVIAQTLTGINIRLAALKKSTSLNLKGLDQNIARTQKLVEHSVDIVHRFARELRPAVLDDLGLIPALHTYLKNFTERTGVRTSITAFAGVEQMDTTERTVLFRVAQEALTNVSRHAQASRVEVSFQKIRGGVSMKIINDGKFFNVEQTLRANRGKRLGLLGMRERLQMVGGKFNVTSLPNQGTTVEAQLPLRKLRGGGADSVR